MDPRRIPLFSIIPSIIACLACLVLFFYYLTAKKRSIEASMVFILSVSDFLYSLMNLFPYLFPSFDDAFFAIIQFFSLYFSIFWASTISFMVYKSLKDIHLNSKKLLFQCFFFVITCSASFAFL